MPVFVSFDLVPFFLNLFLFRTLTDFKSMGFFLLVLKKVKNLTKNLLHFPLEWIHQHGKYDVKFTFLLSLAIIST